MKTATFDLSHAGALRSALTEAGIWAPLLQRDDFLRHYYLSNQATAQLHLLLDRSGRIAATLGSERLLLRMGDHCVAAAVLSHTFSIQPGAFALLMMQWMRSVDAGLVFPGSPKWQEMLSRSGRWAAIPGLRTYWLNWDYPSNATDPAWKQLARPLARLATRTDLAAHLRRLQAEVPQGLQIDEVERIDEAMARPSRDCGFSVEPDIAWLNWRYDRSLTYVRYRLFRVRRNGAAVGCVVLAEWPHCLLVSYGCGSSAIELAYATLLAIAQVNAGPARHRKVILACMHMQMAAVFERYGFRADPRERCFMLASFGQHALPRTGGKDWLLHLDVGEVGAMLALAYLR
jgi:hypothetical protein